MWTGTGWRALVWTDWQTGIIAHVLDIGADDPYEWAESWGPQHPDRDLHDVTAWCRRAVAEYIAPAPDPVAAGIDGFRPQDTWRTPHEP